MPWITCTLVLAAAPAVQAESRTVCRLPEDLKIETRSLRFSRGGKQAAYVGYRGNDKVWVIGDTVGDVHESVEPPDFDAKGEHVVFRVMTRDKKGLESWSLILDGKKVATHAWIGELALSPVDGSPAYWAADRWLEDEDGELEPGLVTLIAGKKKSGRFQLPGPDVPRFSSDGRFVYAAGLRDDESAALILDLKGKESLVHVGEVVQVVGHPNGAELVCTVERSLSTPSDESDIDSVIQETTHVLVRTAATAKRKGAEPVAIGSAYDSAGCPVFSSEGLHLAYRASRGKEVGVVIDGDTAATCEYDAVGEVTFSPAGDEVAYVAIAGCELDPEPKDGYRVFSEPAEADGGEWYVVVGATKSASFARAASPTWSPDGKRVAYAAKGVGSWRVHVQDLTSDEFDEVAAVEWSSDGKSVWIGGRRGRDFLWAPMPLE